MAAIASRRGASHLIPDIPPSAVHSIPDGEQAPANFGCSPELVIWSPTALDRLPTGAAERSFGFVGPEETFGLDGLRLDLRMEFLAKCAFGKNSQ